MRRKNHTHQQDIDDLKRQNALLEQQGMCNSLNILQFPRATSKTCRLFNFQYGHWRKSKGPRSFRPTTRLQTAACTPTPRAAPCRPLTAGLIPAPSPSQRNSVPGRSTARRIAKPWIHKVLLWGEGESQQWPVSCCILCTSISPNHIDDQSLSVNVDSTPEETRERGTSAKGGENMACFYSLSLSDCVRPSCVLAHATTNDDFKPKMRQLCNLRTWCFVFCFGFCTLVYNASRLKSQRANEAYNS